MAHISKPGTFSGLAHQHFKTGPLRKIVFPKERKSAEGKGCADTQRMAKSPMQKGQVTGLFPSDKVNNAEDKSDLFMGAGIKNPARIR